MERRLRRLERGASSVIDALLLEDGTQVPLGPTDRLQALLAALDEEPHPVHQHLRTLHPSSPAQDHELRELLIALGLDDAE